MGAFRLPKVGNITHKFIMPSIVNNNTLTPFEYQGKDCYVDPNGFVVEKIDENGNIELVEIGYITNENNLILHEADTSDNDSDFDSDDDSDLSDDLDLSDLSDSEIKEAYSDLWNTIKSKLNTLNPENIAWLIKTILDSETNDSDSDSEDDSSDSDSEEMDLYITDLVPDAQRRLSKECDYTNVNKFISDHRGKPIGSAYLN